ncbi:hypothetical protein [Aeromonas hydrophila]
MKEDSFIGTTFNDGKLVVTGIAGKNKHGQKEYSCFCSECAKDPELFDNAVFRSLKCSLVCGTLPCGCSNRPKWTAAQYRTLISRKAAGKYSAIIRNDVKAHDKASCSCSVDGCDHGWSTSIHNLLNNGTACPRCAGKAPITEDEAIERVQAICSEKNWIFHGFDDGWKTVQSRLLLTCHCGRSWDPSFSNVIYDGNGCSKCSKHGYNPGIRGWLYCHLWTNPEGHQFLKYGITNYPDNRIKQQSRNTKYTATEIFSLAFEDGSIPERLERAIDEYRKTNNILNPVSCEDFPDGFSETLPLVCLDFIRDLIFQTTMCRLQPIS